MRTLTGISHVLSILAILSLFLLCSCGSPRGDGVAWENTFPNPGDSITQVDKLYGKPDQAIAQPNGDTVRKYSNWRVKNQFGGMMHASDHHTVTFSKDGKAVSWD